MKWGADRRGRHTRLADPWAAVAAALLLTACGGDERGVDGTGIGGTPCSGFCLDVPTRLSTKQRALLEEFRETETGDECPESQGFFAKLKGVFAAE